ncbi:MAG: Spy/CpxP family protein refolding chaperone [Vicinamibacterales bacterium]
MARHIAWVVALLLLSPAAGHAGSLCEQRNGPPAPHGSKQDGKSGEARSGQRPKWWVDPKLRADLGITDQQSAAVESVWSKSLPALREARERLDKLEDALSVMTQREGSDEAAVMAQIERVENTRAEANKTRTLMIYRMNKILTIEQRAKVKALFDRPDASRRGSSPR